MPDRAELYAGLYAWLILAALCLIVAVVGWFWADRPVFPHQRRRAVPWSLFEVLLAFFLLYFVWGTLCYLLMEASGFFTWLYGPLPDAAKVSEQVLTLARTRRIIWVEILAAPLNVVGVIVFFRRLSGTLPYHLGLTGVRAWLNVIAACLTWLVVVPIVYAVELLAQWLYSVWSRTPPEQHPFVTLIEKGQVLPIEVGVLIVLTVVAAPVVEELLFRGVLQRWLCQRPEGGNLAMLVAAVLALWAYAAGKGIGPVLFVAALFPAYIFIEHMLWRWIPEPHVARGILATSLLFGLAHAFAWPDPVPLTALGLGLGWLAYRTQSLVGPMCMHALFNMLTLLTLAILPHV